jgi:hypothetical protein
MIHLSAFLIDPLAQATAVFCVETRASRLAATRWPMA